MQQGKTEEMEACPFCDAALELVTEGGCAGAWFHPGCVTDDTCLLAGQGFRDEHLALFNRRPTVPEGLVDAPAAFEMGFVWAQSLTGQTLEDSRAVGRTLTGDTFKAIAPAIERQIKLQGFDSFRCADDGIVAAKRIILAALRSTPAPDARKPIIMKADRKADASALRTLADYIESDTHLKPGNKVSWSDCLEGIQRHYLRNEGKPS